MQPVLPQPTLIQARQMLLLQAGQVPLLQAGHHLKILKRQPKKPN
jgi:hypothetical protein